jgi:hypothetical protein
MRLTEKQRTILKEATAACFEPMATVRLFGSRTDDTKRGGDIDLLIETTIDDPVQIAAARIRFLSRLYREMGEQKVDVLIDYPGRAQRPQIYEIARAQGICL